MTGLYLDGTGEFLDAWLILVEKMFEPEEHSLNRHICMPAKSSQPGFTPFNPLQYLIRTQKVSVLTAQFIAIICFYY